MYIMEIVIRHDAIQDLEEIIGNTNNTDSGNQSSHIRRINPRNKDGGKTKCNFCESIKFWAKSCSESYEKQMKIKEETFL